MEEEGVMNTESVGMGMAEVGELGIQSGYENLQIGVRI